MCCTVDDLTTGLDLVTQKKTNGRFRCSVLWQAGRPRPQSQPAPVPTPKPDQCVHGMGVSSTSAVAAKVLRGPLFSAASELLHQLLPLHHRLSRGISGPNTQEGALPALLSSRPGLLGLGEDECVGSAAVSHFAAASVNCSVPPSLFLLPLLAGMSNISMESRHHSSGEAWQRVSLGMKEVLARHGIDIIVPFSVAWYNSVVPPALRLPWLGRTQPPLGVVVGNSRALWAPFLDALASQPDLRKDGHPLNTYIKHALDEALAGFQVLDTHVPGETGRDSDRVRALIYWAHDTAPGKLVAMQRLAHLTGIAYFDEESHLCVHPKYGAWFALRAVVVLDVNPPTEEPLPLGNLLDDDAKTRVKAAMKLAMEQPRAVQHDDCGGRSRSSQHDLGHWRLWLAVRDAISPDHPWRYCEEQIAYHYTGNRSILDKLLSVEEV